MKKFTILLFTILLISCNGKQSNEKNYENDFAMYGLLINELDFNIFYLNEQIKLEISELEIENRLDNETKEIDSTTKVYTNKIDKIIDELYGNLTYHNGKIYDDQKLLRGYKRGNDYFFNGDTLSKNAIKYKKLTKEYGNEILKYFDHPIYIKRIQGALSMNDTQDGYGNRTELIEYLFRDTPLIAIILQLKTMKRNSLEYQQQLLRRKPVANNAYKK
ncbi:hypothetical protein [Aquimarina amphilecti]|nr:hypothetical protein [Aquimarina amphilecti]